MKKQAVLVFNPKSGQGKTTMLARDFSDKWKDKFHTELSLRPTRSLSDIRVAARETCDKDEIQLFMGGDGTLSESIQGIAEHNYFDPIQKAVGFLPGGTGNSFLRDFNISDYETASKALLDAIENDFILNIDAGLIRYNEIDDKSPEFPGKELRRIYINIWGIGLIPDITKLAIEMRFIGTLNYTIAALLKIIGHSRWSARTLIDGHKNEFFCNLISVHNSRFTGGSMEIAPPVRVNDGKLFFICSKLNKLELFGLFPSIFKGTHIDNPQIETRFINELEMDSFEPFLMNVDGELVGGFFPHLIIHPGFFKLYMPPERLEE